MPLRRDPLPPGPRRRRRLALAGARGDLAAVVVLAGWAAATSFSSWCTCYAVTGLLADAAGTPARLAALDARDAAAADEVHAVLRLQDPLTQPARDRAALGTAFSVLFISDVHRRTTYPYLQQYVDDDDVALAR